MDKLPFSVCQRALLFLVPFLLLSQAARAADQSLPFISTSGSQFIDNHGKPVLLKGCNLGNYLMLESWMWGKTLGVASAHMFRDGATFDRILRRRFGDEKADHLLDVYRNSWITPRDFALIKSFGFNCVRLPFDYRLIQQDNLPFNLKPDPFHWLDHAVQMARDAGIYVILDLHGTPGGQSLEDHTGEAGQDHLWKSEEDQQRTVQIWHGLAEHFKNESTVAAYDLINEPYGDHTEDCRPVLARLIPQIYWDLRSTGDQHVVFFPGALNAGISFYGNPHNRGMINVAFTEHHYPGLFGSTPSLETQARVLNQELPTKRDYLQQIATPYYLGEFNVVLDIEDPSRLMRAYYDRFAEYGWAGTMWAYKLISTAGGVGSDGWYMVTNANPLPVLDLNDSSYSDLENFFASLATIPLATNDRLRDALTTPTPAPLYLASFPRLPAAPPKDPPASEPDGFKSLDIGGAVPGYTRVQDDRSLLVMGGGQDIFGSHDSFRFVSQKQPSESADVRATILSFLDSAEHAKTGVMARWGDSPDSPMAMVNLFPDGRLALVTRPRAGAKATETKLAAGVQLPVELRLRIAEGHATGMYRDNSGDWQTIGSATVAQESGFRTGLAVCAHADTALTVVEARLGPTADQGLLPPSQEGGNRLIGPNLLGASSFDHSQDVNVEPGKRYEFSISAHRDISVAAKADPSTIELRLESITDHGEITLNTRKFQAAQLPTGKEWKRLTVSGTADGPRLRALVLITSDDGMVKLNAATLVIAKQNAD